MSDLWKWVGGRMSHLYYYEKFKVYSFSFMDCYLIRWGAGTGVGSHLDAIEDKRHYRFNIRLKGESNKLFVFNPIFCWWRFCLFRSDIRHHGLKPTLKPGLLLSFGVAINDRRKKSI